MNRIKKMVSNIQLIKEAKKQGYDLEISRFAFGKYGVSYTFYPIYGGYSFETNNFNDAKEFLCL